MTGATVGLSTYANHLIIADIVCAAALVATGLSMVLIVRIVKTKPPWWMYAVLVAFMIAVPSLLVAAIVHG